MSNVNSACSGQNNFCLKSSVKDGNIEFTVLSSKGGWAAFGIGRSMINSDIYVGWVNSLGEPIVSRRRASNYDLPGVNPTSNFIVSKLAANETESWVKLGFKVTRPIVSDNSITNSSRMIFAHSESKADNVDDSSSGFPFHELSRGLLDPINFLGVGESSASQDNSQLIQNVLVIHGVLFFIAWGVASFLGIFVARYFKNKMGVWWYRVHVGLLLGITGLLSLISFILIVLNVEEPHFDGNHQKIGLTIFILMFIQFALGFISNALWNPQRTHAPWWDKVHWYFGRGLMILAVINIYLGLEEFSKVTGESMVGFIIGYWIWIGILFSMFLLGQFYFGDTQHHKEFSETSEDLSEQG